jgi:acyl carrier protein
MTELVEPRVRGLVAEHLGVDGEELSSDVSLLDDLAADSLDIVELALAIENQFGVVVPESALDTVRTYGDLVELVYVQLRGRRDAEQRAAAQASPAMVWARVVPARGTSHGDLQRAGLLTPYVAETIAEDALRAGPGARLEVAVSSSISDAKLAFLGEQFAWLGRRGIQVNVRRDHHVGPIATRPRPHAAA